jgi:hypothetical protein
LILYTRVGLKNEVKIPDSTLPQLNIMIVDEKRFKEKLEEP